jgi:tRNA(Ile)-lysidine synthase
MDLLYKFNHFIQSNNLFTKKDRILVAVSGGVDSVVLCELMKRAGYDFVIAHCNFQLRGEDSNQDEAFVKGLGGRYGAEILVEKFDTERYAAENKMNIQMAARNLRYEWFKSLLSDSEYNLNYLATAHHANDNIETLLMNFFKGTGISGLKGIHAKESGLFKNIIRPLLFAKKEELISFAQENNLVWREDVSNESNKYTRNYFRNELIPSIQKVFPEVEQNLLDNLFRFSNIAVLYNQSVEQFKKKLLEKKGNEIHIPILKLQQTPAYQTVLFEIIKAYGFTPGQISEAVKLTQAESGKYIESASHKFFRNRNWMILSPKAPVESGYFLIEEQNPEIIFGDNKLSIELLQTIPPVINDSTLALLDLNKIIFPLLLRKWKQGDYFYPLGMNKKKKVSRFFIDNKLSMTEKENVWVLESDKKIIWVVGHRIDNRFKLTEKTKSFLQLKYLSAE